MRRATRADFDTIERILLASFANDPHVRWLLEQSRHPRKLRILIDYVVHQTLRRGEVYLSDCENAVALWDSERTEPLSLHYLHRNISFLFRIGVRSVARALRSESRIHRNFQRHRRFRHLYMIGVLPSAQGRGLASALMDPVLTRMREESIPVFVETANPRNVEVYAKKGFQVFETLAIGEHTVFLMSTESHADNPE